MTRRILFNFILLLFLVFLPWWTFVILLVFALFLFPSFYEAILWAFTADLLYGSSELAIGGIAILFALSALLALGVVEIFKLHLRFY